MAGANPMRTAFTSWKLAKGLYIIPLIMAYRPLLGVGPTYQLLDWEVVLTMLTTAFGLVAFAAGIERYFIRKTTWIETVLFWLAAACLLWPTFWIDIVGFALLAMVVAMQVLIVPKKREGTYTTL